MMTRAKDKKPLSTPNSQNPTPKQTLGTAILGLILLTLHAAAAQRLPDTVAPVHYDITVAPDLAAAKFIGEETIRVRIARLTASITPFRAALQ